MQYPEEKNTMATMEDFESLTAQWKNSENHLRWPHVFILPGWLEVWFGIFGDEATPFIFSVRQGNDLAGIAPLQIKDRTASFIGDAEICDYFDFIVAPESGGIFCHSLLDHVIENGVLQLDFRCLRPESFALNEMLPVVRQRGYEAICEPDGVAVETALPGTWDEYLEALDPKQRHEVKRKLRRLHEAGDVEFRVYDERADILKRLEIFFALFRASRTDKTQFMTPKMERFFNAMISRTSQIGVLKMGVLYLNGTPVACVLCFDYNDALYLYNSGFDPDYKALSAGLLCKVLLLQYAIVEKKKIFDFLKGHEIYKYRLGGREVALSRLRVRIK